MTVDGPSGSGKTTLGRRLAATLDLPLIDTGLFYRAVMVAAVRAGGDPDDTTLTELARRTAIRISTDPGADPAAATLVDGTPAGKLLGDPRRAPLLSRLSALPGVRTALLGAQRELAAGGAVAVGRDCGTVVFPDAVVKIYLQAAERLREQRRGRQLRESGAGVDATSLRAEVAGRDRRDIGRTASPLRPAADARIIDTARCGVEEMVEAALRLCAAAGLRAIAR